jgi:hypothetical protein
MDNVSKGAKVKGLLLNYSITQLLNYSITQLLNYSITQLLNKTPQPNRTIHRTLPEVSLADPGSLSILKYSKQQTITESLKARETT